ncbi:hypothetical protein Ciccas_007655 [Cichlidogyrus casuarinus]|uniref:Uncharacterized protein n=1 Tax=Cichlidogyrus casuarinus TaxID=1844966 RepID=A0ABD2Q2A4_9PLAT
MQIASAKGHFIDSLIGGAKDEPRVSKCEKSASVPPLAPLDKRSSKILRPRHKMIRTKLAPIPQTVLDNTPFPVLERNRKKTLPPLSSLLPRKRNFSLTSGVTLPTKQPFNLPFLVSVMNYFKLFSELSGSLFPTAKVEAGKGSCQSFISSTFDK